MNSSFEIIAMSVLLVASAIGTVGLIAFAIAVFTRVLLKRRFSDYMKEANAAAALVLGALVVSIASLASPTVLALRQNLQLAAHLPSSERTSYVLASAGLGLLQFLLAFVVAILMAILSTKLFDMLTRSIKEYNEVEGGGNLAVGIMLAAIVLGLSLIVREPLDALVSILIPLPQTVFPR
jgi:uncharacterized membrane protein YjfL (UPF0719 family)